MLIGHKRLSAAFFGDPVSIFSAVFHPRHGRRVELGLRARQRQREHHADIGLGVCLCGVRRRDFHAERIVHRVKAADDLVVRAAVVAGRVVIVPRSRAVRDLAEFHAGHARFAAVRDRSCGGKRRKTGAQPQKHRAQKQQRAETFAELSHISSSCQGYLQLARALAGRRKIRKFPFYSL